jgi:hypothetical protein
VRAGLEGGVGVWRRAEMELRGGGGGRELNKKGGMVEKRQKAEKWSRGWRSDQREDEGLEQRGLSEESWSRGWS